MTTSQIVTGLDLTAARLASAAAMRAVLACKSGDPTLSAKADAYQDALNAACAAQAACDVADREAAA